MRLLCVSVLLPLVGLFAFTRPAASQSPPQQNTSQPQAATAALPGAKVVYVSDFDLDVAYRKASPKPGARSSPRSNTGGPSSSPLATKKTAPSGSASATSQPAAMADDSTEETPADRANALINAVSENLVRALTQAGYDARRLPVGSPLPNVGLRIRGVFAEADERNRARRLLIGGEPVTPKMLVFVGVNNLSRPEQPLYELATPPANDPRHGPVITLTSYAPASRFELSRDPSDEELQKIAAKIASDLTALLNTNRLSLTQ